MFLTLFLSTPFHNTSNISKMDKLIGEYSARALSFLIFFSHIVGQILLGRKSRLRQLSRMHNHYSIDNSYNNIY